MMNTNVRAKPIIVGGGEPHAVGAEHMPTNIDHVSHSSQRGTQLRKEVYHFDPTVETPLREHPHILAYGWRVHTLRLSITNNPHLII
ncbi:hypothetical protein BPAE_0054g00390 [Botrytis paeoniae]|uniref:Uncharacterized protein n=1 Tax=Botrytis paeoniae TaxID=278948 RepID=A0A4Z1FYC6_9HELO|nr:hypothetical protein BPAE_0054g00390 [Botrytis paeoniae]